MCCVLRKCLCKRSVPLSPAASQAQPQAVSSDRTVQCTPTLDETPAQLMPFASCRGRGGRWCRRSKGLTWELPSLLRCGEGGSQLRNGGRVRRWVWVVIDVSVWIKGIGQLGAQPGSGWLRWREFAASASVGGYEVRSGPFAGRIGQSILRWDAGAIDVRSERRRRSRS